MSGCGDRGRVSILLAICLAGLVVVIGAAADGAGQLRTMLHADALAAEAARAAGQAIDIDHTAATGEHRVSPTTARAAAEQYLTQAGVDTADVTFGAGQTQVTVTVELVYQPRILSLFGMPPTTVTGVNTAALVPG